MYEYKATCVKVVDGDTVDLDIDLGFSITVRKRTRLLGINTPETYGVKKHSVEWKKGMEAKWRVVDLIEGKKVMIRTHMDRTGKFGRILAHIYHTGFETTSLNQLLVDEGLAEVYVP